VTLPRKANIWEYPPPREFSSCCLLLLLLNTLLRIVGILTCFDIIDIYCLFFLSDRYQNILHNADQLLSPLGLQLLKFSLSIRNYSPRIAMFNRVSLKEMQSDQIT